MFSILIVDSNRSRCAILSEIIILSLPGGIELLRTSSAEECLRLIYQEERAFDLIFLASVQKEETGFHLAEQVRKQLKHKQVPIVFITDRPFQGLAHISHNETNSFLINPLLERKSMQALSQFLENLVERKIRLQESRLIYINHVQGETFLEADSILFLEIRSKNCIVYTAHGSLRCKREALTNILERLNVPYIKRCHRCFAVNIKQVKACKKIGRRLWEFQFDETKEVCYVSETFYASLKKQCHFIP